MIDVRLYVEFRIYRLKPDVQARFHELVERHSIPMLAAVNMEVIAYGPIVEDPTGYILIRAYDSPEHLQMSQDEFYESDAWRSGPRDEILGLIESSEAHEAWYTKSSLDSFVLIMAQRQEPNSIDPNLPSWGIKRLQLMN